MAVFFLPAAWSCGPAQVYGLYAVPRGLYEYWTSKTEEDAKNNWESMKFNATCTIPLFGTYWAMDADNKKRREQEEENKNKKEKEEMKDLIEN